MSDYESDDCDCKYDCDYDTDHGYYCRGPKCFSEEESLSFDSDCLFGERKKKVPKVVEAGESSTMHPLERHIWKGEEGASSTVNPPVVEISDDETSDNGPTPMKSKAELDGRDALEARKEEVKQVLAYFKDRQERDMMGAGPSQQAPKKLHRSWTL